MDEATLKATLKLLTQAGLAQKTPKRMVVQTETKLKKKFDGTGNYQEWRSLADAALVTRIEDNEKLSLLLGALEGKALREVQRHSEEDRETSTKVLGILQNKYGDRRTAAQILREFHQISQGETSVNDYSDKITECLEGTEERLGIDGKQKDRMLRDHFVENVSDSFLRWELKKTRDAEASGPTKAISFDDLRDIALEWENAQNQKKETKKPAKSGQSTASAALEVDPQVKQLADIVAKQQLQINAMAEQQKELLESLKNLGRDNKSGGGDDSRSRCFYCNKPGHRRQYCRQRQRDERQRHDGGNRNNNGEGDWNQQRPNQNNNYWRQTELDNGDGNWNQQPPKK